MVDGDVARVGIAFGVALCLSWFLMPAAIKLGIRWGLVVRPRLFNKGRGIISILGGVALATGASAGFIGAWGIPRGTGAFLFAALGLLILGFLDDRCKSWLFNPSVRLVIQAGIAATAWLAGLRSDTSGLLGAFFTILVLTAAMNSFNLLDNMDGVAGSTGAAVAAGIGAVGLISGQYMVASLAAALCGACLGFLRFNFKDARIYLGNGGSLFLGFVLGGAALKLRLPLDFPWGPVGMLVLLSIPALDTSVVMVSRLLAGRKVMEGGVDHISHRLVGSGLTKAAAASAHAGASLLAAAGVAASVATGSPEILVTTLAIFALVGAMLLQVEVYPEKGSEPAHVWAAPPVLTGALAEAGEGAND